MLGAREIGHLCGQAPVATRIYLAVTVLPLSELDLVRPLDGRAPPENGHFVVVERLRVEAFEPIDVGQHISRSTAHRALQSGTSQPKRRASFRSSAKCAP